MKKSKKKVNALHRMALFLTLACFNFLFSTGCKTGTGASNTAILPVAPGAVPQLISSQFSFTEGPAVNRNGDVFFTDQPNNKIWQYSTDGRLSLFMDSAGRSNGMYFDKKGNLLTCADEHNQLWSVAPDKKVTVLLNSVDNKKLNGPNDLWIAPNGNIYFSDPYYQRPYWSRTQPGMEGQHVYLLPPGKTTAQKVIGNLEKPNGIVGTPDGKWLFVADIKAGKTYRYQVQPNGLLEAPRLFTEMGSDGLTLDENGNLYLTGNGVTIVDKEGKKLQHIPLPGWTANVVFGGKKRDILFITAGRAIYTLRMRVRGAN